VTRRCAWMAQDHSRTGSPAMAGPMFVPDSRPRHGHRVDALMLVGEQGPNVLHLKDERNMKVQSYCTVRFAIATG
jgi:hypothetical protein